MDHFDHGASTGLPPRGQEIIDGVCGDPFFVLGRHNEGPNDSIRAFFPNALTVRLIVLRPRSAPLERPMRRVDDAGFYVGTIKAGARYRFKITWADESEEIADPYSFGLLLSTFDLHLFAQGRLRALDEVFGAQPMTIDGVSGTRFAVWAPNARRVSVIGDFNIWDGRRHPMRLRHEQGVWELFIPHLRPGERYKYEIMAHDGRVLPQKADPVARATERPPATASLVGRAEPFDWTDETWMDHRAARHASDAPISIYEVHAPSWRRPNGDPDRVMSWSELAEALVPYVLEMGFTHIELLPISEYPFGGSWGYQPLGLFAPTARHGSAGDLAGFINTCHMAGIGVIVDWVPAHFPNDIHGLMRFDGTALYEHSDPREGFHTEWNTLIYNFGRNEVRGFLIAAALHWLHCYHIDGLRVDAVASMLYRDYSRAEGHWVPNVHGGRENLEAVAFLRELNESITERHPGALVIAEESTAWPGVTRPVQDGGLGFSYKWNMGWMHDTLAYFRRDPIHRRHHHHDLLFGLHYGFSERYVLPLSHDEVVHGKGSLIARMPGDDWQRHANLRAYFGFMWGHPGKKLLFMGGEIAQRAEWSHDGQVDWPSLDAPLPRGVQSLVRALNQLMRHEPALHRQDCEPDGFRWIIDDDADNSVFVWLRLADGAPPVLVICNLTPLPRHGYRIGLPVPGFWQERLNTDSALFGGSNVGNSGGVHTTTDPSHGYGDSAVFTLPPLGTLFFVAQGV
ncbi:glycogen branching protein [Ameyamaea chiangmaiensis NBRC 103196]|uniref:1,4-alpha-glucan branching enzyme GlgB n=1 Tax=Ameyamaea chiangmaiensis TaxID=442969 RepID=A0A850P924_9PROT|nr:1,4-alpha-glucan branching protein GlgB [Ameyamaea chiangmaiensis]MBS4074689.1 1,4-alpha-glucan branching protein GlgB [Ameyamaea chiangmaiensis]NVN40408.1 1,4-alpha-glucan branching protein GlgB [Ameyamaea chiangmaiensis]GBQ62373.1 glycogen branching protein [Ameyamaea chiangmaiensis NBRC 103196]